LGDLLKIIFVNSKVNLLEFQILGNKQEVGGRNTFLITEYELKEGELRFPIHNKVLRS
jgi:hypothetical protein